MSAAVESWVGGGTQPRAPRHRAELTFDEQLVVAERLANVEGFVPKYLLGRPPAVLATIMAGAELGLGPLAALRSIWIIEGRVSLSAEVARGLVQARGHEIKWVELSDTKVAVIGRRAGEEAWTPPLDWTMDRARRAKLAGKAVWQQYPRQMLEARASSELCHLHFADVLAGIDVLAAVELEPPEPEDDKPKTTRVRARATVPPPSLPGEGPSVAAPQPEPPDLANAAPEPEAPVWQPARENARTWGSARAAAEAGEAPRTTAEAPEPPPVDSAPPRDSAPQRPPLPGEEPAQAPEEPAPPEPVAINQGPMLRRLHARMAETFPTADRETIDAYRHALVALVTRRREEGGPVSSSALLTEAEQMGFESRLVDIAMGRAWIGRTPSGTVQFRLGGWCYEVTLEPPLSISATQESSA